MKPSIILEQRLHETKMYSRLISGMTPETVGYMQTVRESFTLPFIASLSNINVLTEAAMTAQQIQNAFGSAEKIATAGGDNRSMLGKGADAAGAAAGAIGQGAMAAGKGAKELAAKGAAGVKQLADKLVAQYKAKLQQSLPPADAGPVEGFEQKAQEQIDQVQDPKAKKSLMDLVKQAAKNPAVQTMVLAGIAGIATAVAGPAIAGLGLGMAATGALTGTVVGGLTGVVRGAMQGEGLKGALKQGAMGAGLGALGGGVAGAIAQGAQAYMQNKNQPTLPAASAGDEQPAVPPAGAPAEVTHDYNADTYRVGQMGRLGGDGQGPNAPGNAPSGIGNMTNDQVKAAADSIAPVAGGDADPNKYYNSLTPDQQRATDDAIVAQANQSAAGNPVAPDADRTPLRVRPNLDQWRADNAAAKTVTQSRVNLGTPLNEYVDYELTARMWYLRESVGKTRGNIHLTEAGIGDMFRKAGNWLKTKAGNVTNKVTADKLQQAWKKAGNPTDSGQVAGIMVSAGVPQETVDQIFQNLGLPAGSSTPAQAPAQAKAPGQGLLGKAAGAVGGAIGGVKGAIAGTKDAFAKGKETGFDSARANQAGDALGATGEANPYANQGTQQTEPTLQGQQPSYGQGQAPQAYGVQPRSTQASQGQPTQSTASTSPQGTTDAGNNVDAFGAIKSGADSVGSAVNKTGMAAADAVNDLNRAVQSGKGMGASGQSLVRGPYAPGGEGAGKDAVKIKDEYGQDHAYKKVGAKWYDAENKEVPSAIAAMLNKQAEQQAALTKPKTPAAQTTQEPATATAPAAPAKAEPIKVGGQTLDPKDPASAKIIAQVQQQQGGAQQPAQAAAGGAQQPAGKPAQPSATPAAAGQAAPANKGNYDPNTGAPISDKAKSDAAFAASPQGQANQAKVDAMPAPSDAGQPAQAQSPEEIRKAKQTAAAKVAQDQMAANAATPAGQTAPAPAKTHTGGKVAGQLSQTPNAIRKREQRAAAAQAKTAANDVMARMAKQLGTAPTGGPAQTMPGYGKVTYNVPTAAVPQQPAVQPTTGARTVPAPAPTPTAAPEPEKFGSRGIAGMDAAPATAPAAAKSEVPGFLQSKIKGRKEPVTAGIDFSAALLRKMKQRV